MKTIFQESLNALQNNQPAAIITIIEIRGSVPQSPGAKLLVTLDLQNENVQTYGTIGGGKLEFIATEEATQLLKGKETTFAPKKATKNCFLFEKSLTKDIGMICGGEVVYFIEILELPIHLIICGAGHCGQALSKAAKNLNYQITVIDSFKEYANDDRFPDAKEIINTFDEQELDQNLQYNPKNCFIVVVARDHSTDFKMVRYFMNKDWAYIGLIASKRKALLLKSDLMKEGFSKEKVEKLHSPIGLDIGGDSPSEIAIAILGEIIKVKNSVS